MRRGMRTGLKYAVAAMAAVSMAVTGCAGSGTGNSAKDSGISAAADRAQRGKQCGKWRRRDGE